MENSMVRNQSENNGSKINVILPKELLKNILKNLDYKSLCSAKQSCNLWKEIIVAFKLTEKATRKFLDSAYKKLSFE